MQSILHRHSCPAGTVPAAVTSVALCAPQGLLQNLSFAKGKSLAPKESLCTGLGAEAAGFWLSTDYLLSGSPGVKNPGSIHLNLPGIGVQIVTIWPSQGFANATSLKLLHVVNTEPTSTFTVFLCSAVTHPWASQHGAACWHSALPAFSAPP